VDTQILNFIFSAPVGLVLGWILRELSLGAGEMTLEHYQTGFAPLLLGVAVAIVPHRLGCLRRYQ
jgi:hypothetical protein